MTTGKATADIIYAEQMTQRETLARIEARLDKLQDQAERAPRAQHATAQHASGKSGGGEVAPDSDMDSQYGDPEIRKDPPKWAGESMVGKRYSQCSADYLLSLAGFLEWKAGKNESEGTPDKIKYAGYDRRDAARCRGWARRNANGASGQPAASRPADDFGREAGADESDDQIPFLRKQP